MAGKKEIYGSVTPNQIISHWQETQSRLISDKAYQFPNSFSPQGDVLREAGVPTKVIGVMDEQSVDLLTAAILKVPTLQSVMLRKIAKQIPNWVDVEELVRVLTHPETFMGPNSKLTLSLAAVAE